MNLAMLLEMAADGLGDRIAVGDLKDGLSYRTLLDRARRIGALLADRAVDPVVLVDVNAEAVPITLFGAAIAGKPFVPVNYRLADDRLRDVLGPTAPSLAIVEPDA